MNPALAIATIGGATLLGVVVPWVAMRMLIGSLLESPSAHALNYAGRPVAYGLGVVWVVWAGCAMVAGALAVPAGLGESLGVLAVIGALALVAFAMGLIDDAYGTSAAKGFKGHIKAMLRGHLTTGGLKLLGIGLSSLVVAALLSYIAPWASDIERFSTIWAAVVALAGAAVALTSNLLNLFDLRPGRALKVYSVFAAAGVVVYGSQVTLPEAGASLVLAATGVAVLGVFVFGPVVAIWPHDVGERGMLGDAGANPMGAVAGTLIVAGLPLWALVAYLVAVFALNLASERVSFSRVIASSPVLSWLDGLGRLTAETGSEDSGKTSRHSEGNHE